MGRRPKIQFSNGDIPMAKGPMKRCSTREMQTNTWVRYYLTPVRIAIVKGVQITSVGKAVEEKDLAAAAAAAKSLQLCPTLCDPIDVSPPGSPSLGFSRQEHWSGLPFPSPMPESEKWKWSRSVVSDSLRPHGLQPTRLLCPWDFPGKSTGVGCHHLLWKGP